MGVVERAYPEHASDAAGPAGGDARGRGQHLPRDVRKDRRDPAARAFHPGQGAWATQDFEGDTMVGNGNGGCLCGAVRYALAGTPKRRLCCHCGNCRRQSGGPMMGYLVMEAGGVEVLRGVPQRFASSEDGERQFCGTCGSGLFFVHRSRPGTLIVTAGSLDDFGSFEPDVHIWTGHAAVWLQLPVEVPRFPWAPGR